MSSTTSSSVGEDTPKQSKPRGSNALACTSTNRVFFLLNLSFTAVLALFFFKLQHGRVSQLFTSVPMSTLSSRLRPAVETLAGADAPAGARKGHVWHLVRQYTYCLAAEAPEPGTFHIKEKTRVRLKRCDPNDSLQHWWYNPKTFQIQAKKRNAHKKRLCLDLYLDGSGFKGNVQLFRCRLSDNQQWEIRQTPVKAHGQIVSKKRGKNKNLICLTTRSKTALGEAAWKSYFSNMPQMFKDHYKSTLGDYVAARICSKEYRFFYTRMQRWRMPKLAITMGSGTKQAHVHSRVPTHDGISVILTVTSLDAGAAMEEHVRDMYPGIQVIILVGTAFDATMAANTESKVISIQRVLENPAHLEEMLETPYVLLMTTSNRLKPDFDLYTLVETLESDPTSLAATGFAVGKDNTLFRPCYTAVQVPVSELRAFESDRAKRFAKLSKRTELEASKEDLVHLAEYRRSAMRRSGSKGVNSDKDMKAAASNAEDPINALDELPLGINDDRRRRRLSSEGNSAVKQWVEGFFQLNAETSAMACDRGAKPALVRTKDVITFIQQDLGDTSGTHSGAANWSPNELVSGIAVTSNGQTVMRRIAVNPAFLSDTTAFKCSLQPTKFAPKRDCFLPPDNMEAPIPLEDIWATNSTCRKVLGTDERRDQLRGLSEALDVFGRSIHQTNFYYMDGSLLGLIKLGTFAPWDTDGDIMLQLPRFFEYNDANVKTYASMIYKSLKAMQLSVKEDPKKLAWVNPSTFHIYLPLKAGGWFSSWHSVCDKNKDYTLNEPWPSCLKKLKNKTNIYSKGYKGMRVQTDLHVSVPETAFGKDTLMTPNLRIADRDFFHFVPYHFIETLYWWYDKNMMYRNPWDCEWRFPLYYPPYSTEPAT